MSDRMKYNHAAIDGHAVAIQGSSAAFTGMLEDLAGELKALEANWEGSGSEAYVALKRQWDQAAAGLNSTLNQVGKVVGTGNDDMNHTDGSVASGFGA